MQFEYEKPKLIEEKRLVKTLITGRPSKNAFFIATCTAMLISLVTWFYWQNTGDLAHYLPAVNAQIFQHSQWWRIFTAVLIHADIEHLLSNLYMLWILSFFIFGYFGFRIFPLASYLISALVNLLAIKTYPPDIELLGASGWVYVLGGFWLTMYVFIQRQYPVMNRLLRVTGIALVVFLPSTFAPTTSYRTHAIGFLLGVAMGIFYFIKNKKQIRNKEVYKTTFVEDIAYQPGNQNP